MNLEQTPSSPSAHELHRQRDTQLRGGWLIAVRTVWGAAVLFVLVLFLVSLPTYWTYLQIVCVHQPCPYQQLTPSSAQAFQLLGISVKGYAVLTLTLTLGPALIWMAMGGLLIWRRSHDWMALLVAFLLVVGGASNALYSGFTTSQEGWSLPANILGFLFSTTLFVVCSLFPSGTFVPRWMRWLIPVFLLNNFLYQFFPDWLAHLPVWVRFLGLFYFLASLLLLVLAQVYRYLRLSTAVQRQQTKWIVYSLTLGVGAMLGWSLLENLIPSLNGSIYDPINAYLNDVGSLLLPIAFAISILRYRLWDIDILINRTLVYGGLSACVVGLYVFVVGYLGALFRTGSTLPISLVATGLVAVFFQPLRELLQRGVNRLLYGQRDEPYQVITRLNQRLEATGTADTVLPSIVETVAQALKLPYAAITLKHDDEFSLATAYGIAKGELVHLPLVYQSEQVGELLLAPRAPGESFTSADHKLLDDLARQVGVAAHALRLTQDLQQLTQDLQQARERLVTAREEERRRLRRDLHDGLGPQLSSQTLLLTSAQMLLRQDPDEVEAILKSAVTQSQQAISDIRRLVYALRPPALDDLGLLVSIEEQLTQYRASGIAFSLDAPKQLPALPAAVEVACYRIVQEALTNVVRHAQAHTCVVRLLCQKRLTIEVIDDGLGLPTEYSCGVGLNSMRERAEELGGSWYIEPGANGGTCVHAELPMSREKY